MARGINRVILIGNVGGDPEVKQIPNGNAVANITLATSESWTDKQSNQKMERVEWHRVAFFNRLAEIVGEYVKKGSKIYAEGQLRTRKWQDQSGQDRYTTEIVASEMQMLDSRGDNQGYTAPQQPAQQPKAPVPQGYPQGVQNRQPQQPSSSRKPDDGCCGCRF